MTLIKTARLSITASFILVLSINVSAQDQNCQTDKIPKSIDTGRYTVDSDGNVQDSKTKLIWQRCAEGLSGNACDSGEAELFTWGEALEYASKHASNKGQAESVGAWRIPNIRELASIVELQCSSPAVSVLHFPNTPLSHSWSSSPYEFYPHYSWYVDFDEGGYNYADRTDKKYLRLVRDM